MFLLYSRMNYAILLLVLLPYLSRSQAVNNKADSLRRFIATSGEDTTRVTALNQLIRELYYDSIQRAVELSEEAITLAQKLDFKPGEQRAYSARSYLYVLQHNYEQAINYNLRSRTLAIALCDSFRIGRAYTTEGLIYFSMGDYPRAIEAYQQSMRIDAASKHFDGLAMAANNLGLVYKDLGDIELATKYLQVAQKNAEKSENKQMQAMSLSSLGEVYVEKKEYDQALAYLNQSLDIGRELNITKGIVVNTAKIGEVFYYQGRYAIAARMLQESLTVSQEVGDRIETVNALNYLAKTRLAQQQEVLALKHARAAYALAIEIDALDKTADAALILSNIYEASGNTVASLDYFKQYNRYQDSLFTLEKTKQIAELETQYQTAQKEQQINELEQQQEVQQLRDRQRSQRLTWTGIALLILTIFTIYLIYQQIQRRRANRQLRVQKDTLALRNEQVQRALNDKELLIQEINHRTKNNLYTIESLLKAQLNQIQDTEAKVLIQESQSRIHSISLLHQQLFTGDLPDSVNMQSYLNTMLNSYFSPASSVTVRKEIDYVVIDSARAVALGLIVNELVTNSIKHAFAATQRGILSVSFQQKNTSLQLEVEDYSEPSEADSASQPTSTSFGLTLVRGLTEQLRGTMDVIRQSGFLVRIVIPY